MKVVTNLVLFKPPEIGIQETIMEDVKSFEFGENEILVRFNNSPDVHIPLRSNDGVENVDWRAANIQITRKFLEVDMNK